MLSRIDGGASHGHVFCRTFIFKMLLQCFFFLSAIAVAFSTPMIIPADQQQQECSTDNTNNPENGFPDSWSFENENMIKAIDAGRLSEARWSALQNFHRAPECKGAIVHNYVQAVNRNLMKDNEQQDDNRIGVEVYLQRVSNALQDERTPQRRVAPKSGGRDILFRNDGGETTTMSEEWDDNCCSLIPPVKYNKPSGVPGFASFHDSSFSATTMTTNQNNNDPHECLQKIWCDIYPFSNSHLKLPALHEPALRLQIPTNMNMNITSKGSSSSNSISRTTTTSLPTNDNEKATESPLSFSTKLMALDIEQDGYLRPYDVSGILWPAGYLLGLCVANLDACGASEVKNTILKYQLRRRQQTFDANSPPDDNVRVSSDLPPIAIELGSGTGIPSIALSLILEQQQQQEEQQQPHSQWRNSHIQTPPTVKNRVVATDYAPHAVALTMANSYWNHAHGVTATFLDHTNVKDLKKIKERFFPTTITSNTTISKDEHQNANGGDGFALVMGSALQGLFHSNTYNGTPANELLFTILDTLLVQDGGIAMFVHTVVDPVMEPSNGNFSLVRRISGDIFGMATFAGQSSDFEISIFQRKRQQPLSFIGNSNDKMQHNSSTTSRTNKNKQQPKKDEF